MEGFRSKSCRDGCRMEMMNYYNGSKAAAPRSMQGLRSYSVSCGSSSATATAAQPSQFGKEVKIIKKGKNSNLGSCLKSWSLNDPELERKKRVASYKVYAMEGKMKGSLKKSFKWIKDTYTQVIYGCH